MRRLLAVAAVPWVAALVIVACGGTPMTPTQPSNGGGGGGGNPCTPPANTPPVIVSITTQGTRANEPADFADVGEAIPVVASVQDAETPADQLTYQWTAPVGTFSATGASVIWQAPAKGSISTPMDVTITLTVIENYGCPGQPPTFQNTVSATHTLSLHDSVAEVGGMATQFLLDFSDSKLTDIGYVMRNFDPVCTGTVQETQQVTTNRQNFNIVHWNVGTPSATVPFGNTFCHIDDPARVQRGDACVNNHVHWESTILRGPQTGDLQVADGIDWVAAYYRLPIHTWRLCDSQFTGTCIDQTKGTSCANDMFPSMVPGRIR
jgi:hypothetical protein